MKLVKGIVFILFSIILMTANLAHATNKITGDYNGDGSLDAFNQSLSKGASSSLTPEAGSSVANFHISWTDVHPDISELSDWSAESYGAYSSNLNSSPGDELLLLGKKQIILLHGDIITPILIPKDVQNAIISWSSSGVASLTTFDLDVDPNNYIPKFSDFDGDGVSEIFLQSNSTSGTSYSVNGSGVVLQSFHSGYLGVDWSTNSQIDFIDLNGDGRSDMQITDSGGNVFVIYASTTGSFETTPVELTEGWSNTTFVSINNASPVSPNVSNDLNLDGYSIPGQGGVSGGQASYSIPIELPPARNKVGPSVSLSYNSQGGNGVVGVGWSLSATQSISRCSSTYVQDGLSRSVDFSSTDRLCLNGSRLIAISGTYGENGTVYRTEMDSFVKVEQTNALNDSDSEFDVYYSNGQVLTFGGTTDSTVSGITSIPHQWKLSQISATSGKNVVDYVYDDSVTGENLLSGIFYTRNNTNRTADTMNDREVSFVYETRLDTDQFWIGNRKQVSTRRLAEINTFVGNTAVYSYRLGYNQSQASNRSLLASVNQCGDLDESLEKCSSATTFDWFQQEASYIPESTPIDTTGYLHLTLPSGDKNSDGSPDWNGYFVNAEGEFTANGLESVDNCYFNRLSGSKTCHNADLNLDGYGDAVQINKSTYNIDIGISNGTTFTWTPTAINVASGLSSITYIGDLNGDAYPDLMVNHYSTSSSDIYFYPHSQNNNTPYSLANRQLVESIPTQYSPGLGYLERDGFSAMGDMNGDGTVDFVYSQDSGSGSTAGLRPHKLIFTKPNSDGTINITSSSLNFESSAFYDDSNGLTWSRFQIYADINGDNLRDWLGFYKPGQNGNKLYVRLNNAGIFAAPVDTGLTISTRNFVYSEDLSPTGNGEVSEGVVARFGGSYRAMDVDGDGKDEIIFPGAIAREACYKVRRYNGSFKEVCGASIYGSIVDQKSVGIFSSVDERWDFNIYEYNVARFENDIFTIDNGVTLYGAATHTSVADAFGNGLTDLVFSYGCGTTACRYIGSEIDGLTEGKINVMRNYGSGSGASNSAYQPVDYMQRSTDGLGNTNEWFYRPLSTNMTSVDGLFYDTDHPGTPEGYFHFTSSMYAVQSIKTNNGIGGYNSIEYAYRGAMYHAQGRGFTGFNEIFEKQLELDKVTKTTFDQEFPRVGLLEKQETTIANTLVQKVTNEWKDNPQHNVLGIYHNYLDTSEQWSYGLDGLELSHTLNKVNSVDVDQWGNIKKSVKTIENGFSTVVQINENFYTNDELNWWLGKLDKNVKTFETTSGAVLRNTYSSLDPEKKIQSDYRWHDASRQVERLQVTPVSGGGIATESNTIYNNYGLPLEVAVSEKSDTGNQRTVTTNYTLDGTNESADGYFSFEVTNDLGHKVVTETNIENGSVSKATDVNGFETNFIYDAVWRPVQVTPTIGLGTVVKTRYEECLAGCGEISGNHSGDISHKITSYSAGKPVTTEYKDSFNRTLYVSTESFSGAGAEEHIYLRTEYDGLGRKTFESVPSFSQTEVKGTNYISYDGLGRLTSKSIDQPHNQSMDVTYSYAGHLTTINANALTMYRTHSGNGQLIKTQDALAGVTDYAYDNMGNPIILQDANGHAIQASYNALGQKTLVDDPNMGDKSFSYTPFGEVLTETDANGATYKYIYDDLGRVTERLLNNVTEASFLFDTGAKGNTVDSCFGAMSFENREDLSGSENFSKSITFDSLCRVKSLTTTIDSVDYISESYYDDFYARVKGVKTITGMMVETRYNERGYQTQILNAASGYVYQQNLEYDARLQLENALKANGVLSETLNYAHESGQMTEVAAHAIGGDQRHLIQYEYDDFGNLDLQTVENMVNSSVVTSTEDYDYDDLHRLILSTTNIGGTVDSISYDYDAVGNITIKSDHSSDFTYGDIAKTNGNAGPNAVRQVVKSFEIGGGVESYEYDGNGNMLRTLDSSNQAIRTLTYNAFNKPLTIAKGGVTSSFSYGSSQMRYKQVKTGIEGGTETTVYVDKAYEEISQNGVTTKRLYLGDAIINETVGGANSGFKIGFVHRDRLGSTVTITDDSGNVVDNKSFDPFGKVRKGTFERIDPMNIASLSVLRTLEGFVETTDRGFTDHEHLDEVELIHMNGRVYDYNLGRFLSVDPFIQDPGNSQSLNPYSYILNNPLAGTDPSGYVAQYLQDTDIKSIESIEITANGNMLINTKGDKDPILVETVNGHDAKGKFDAKTFDSLKAGGLKEVTQAGKGESTSQEINGARLNRTRELNRNLSDEEKEDFKYHVNLSKEVTEQQLLHKAMDPSASKDLRFEAAEAFTRLRSTEIEYKLDEVGLDNAQMTVTNEFDENSLIPTSTKLTVYKGAYEAFLWGSKAARGYNLDIPKGLIGTTMMMTHESGHMVMKRNVFFNSRRKVQGFRDMEMRADNWVELIWDRNY